MTVGLQAPHLCSSRPPLCKQAPHYPLEVEPSFIAILWPFKVEFVENCDYESSFLYAFLENLYGLFPSIQLLSLMSHKFEFPHNEQDVLIVDGFLKALLLGNFHGFQFYHFHFKEFMWLLFCGKKMNGSFKVLNVHPCDIVKTTFENGVFQLTLKDPDEKLAYPISFIDYLLKCDILKDLLVQNTTSCVKLLNQSFGGILLYSLTLKEFLDELISLLYCKEELGGLFSFKEMEHQIERVMYMGQAIKDCLISKSAFDERSLSGLTNFCEGFIKELSSLASLLVDVPRRRHIKLLTPTLLLSFEIDYGGNLLMSIDMMFLSIAHTLSLDQKKKMEFIEFIHFKNHEAYEVIHKMFGMTRLVLILEDGWISRIQMVFFLTQTYS
ncbi:hypothetical protein M9H77_07184 [Catharanthus roseus]|uniref:Uncharacterized protein n=1 Tax=Catharanthus roseus TaxID=4058 RepID=A0ACC0BU77_CATRO|nr:hypothetical protein M9H77_07184 [Catharanthus roseus]